MSPHTLRAFAPLRETKPHPTTLNAENFLTLPPQNLKFHPWNLNVRVKRLKLYPQNLNVHPWNFNVRAKRLKLHPQNSNI
ncbi:MAG: hypothetical protein KAF91_14285 [Nostoc sp. TH1S01]|nr:hypothetical protein [Nostoc sp. TH1S01]